MKIDKDIPIPPRQRGRGPVSETEYPWSTLEVGDSFLLPGDPAKQRNRAEVSFYNWRIRWLIAPEDYRITTRAVEGGLRVWRTQ